MSQSDFDNLLINIGQNLIQSELALDRTIEECQLDRIQSMILNKQPNISVNVIMDASINYTRYGLQKYYSNEDRWFYCFPKDNLLQNSILHEQRSKTSSHFIVDDLTLSEKLKTCILNAFLIDNSI